MFLRIRLSSNLVVFVLYFLYCLLIWLYLYCISFTVTSIFPHHYMYFVLYSLFLPLTIVMIMIKLSDPFYYEDLAFFSLDLALLLILRLCRGDGLGTFRASSGMYSSSSPQNTSSKCRSPGGGLIWLILAEQL